MNKIIQKLFKQKVEGKVKSEYDLYLEALLVLVKTDGVKVNKKPADIICYMGRCFSMIGKFVTIYDVYECADGIKYTSIAY